MGKTGITEAALAVLFTNGFDVVKSVYQGGIENIDTTAFGLFIAGIVAFLHRQRQKKNG